MAKQEELRPKKRGNKYNSFVADGPNDQHGIDIAYMSDPKQNEAIRLAKYIVALHAYIKTLPEKKVTLNSAVIFLRKQDGYIEALAKTDLGHKTAIQAFDPFRIESLGPGKAEVRLASDKGVHLKGGKGALLATDKFSMFVQIDVFSKKCHAVAMETRDAPEIKKACEKCISVLGTPRSLFMDQDGGFTGEFLDFVEEKGIVAITTAQHSPFAERMIRTLKAMLGDRVKGLGKSWDDH